MLVAHPPEEDLVGNATATAATATSYIPLLALHLLLLCLLWPATAVAPVAAPSTPPAGATVLHRGLHAGSCHVIHQHTQVQQRAACSVAHSRV